MPIDLSLIKCVYTTDYIPSKWRGILCTAQGVLTILAAIHRHVGNYYTDIATSSDVCSI